MDLVAYAQISDLEKIAKDNNIVVPRLRGYRLMKDEEPISVEDIKKMMKKCEVDICKDLCTSYPYWSTNTGCYRFSRYTDLIEKYYLIEGINEYGYKAYISIRWDRIHGWKRKVLKFEIKKQKKRIQEQFNMWNKYVGNENVLYIHARIGGNNWNNFDGNELAKSPWFLDKVNDSFDNTYCDIYAKIK